MGDSGAITSCVLLVDQALSRKGQLKRRYVQRYRVGGYSTVCELCGWRVYDCVRCIGAGTTSRIRLLIDQLFLSSHQLSEK